MSLEKGEVPSQNALYYELYYLGISLQQWQDACLNGTEEILLRNARNTKDTSAPEEYDVTRYGDTWIRRISY